jgi:ATP adenylyltransferase
MLWNRAEEVAKKALTDGYLMPIATSHSLVEQDGVGFVLYRVDGANGQSKPSQYLAKGSVDPFLPYQQELLVAELDPDYVCLLNMFPVLSPHLLICTRDFVEQEKPLTMADFSAWLRGFERPGLCNPPEVLGFYNSGPTAGASQPHRHMQLVQTPVAMADRILNGRLGFCHYLVKYPQLDGQLLFSHYQQAMQQLGLNPVNGTHSSNTKPYIAKPYNILLTERWMLIVPRCNNGIKGVSANGMNYAGLFLVKNEQQAQWLCNYGLLKFLMRCSRSEDSPTP